MPVAASGYHPWYSHTISLDDEVTSREDHYRSLLIDSRSTLQAKEELEALLPHLPPPRSLKAILSELRTHLEEFPSALLGEVGLDRAFRIPAAKHVVQDQPSEQGLLDSQPPTNEHTLALRGKRLTTLSVPIEHQLKVVLAQIGVAVDLGRSVSFHSVRAPEATIQLLKESCRVYNGANGRAFRDICLDLHSCTLSEEMISAILRTHPNVFVSFSVTINLRQKSLASQLSVVPPTRLLIESDWHTAGDLAERNYEMLKMATPYVLREEPGACKDGGDVNEAAKSIAHNWERFDRSLAQRRGDVDMENDGDDDELEEASHETIRKFEANWWKQMKCLR